MTASVGGSTYGETDTITDDEIARASVPNLGALMKSAVDRGLIAPVKSYTDYSRLREALTEQA
jgi:hypothetical protein